jgi:hypothetical protein
MEALASIWERGARELGQCQRSLFWTTILDASFYRDS